MDRPPPDFYQPRLSWWGHTWRFLAVATVSGVAAATSLAAEFEHTPPLLAADLALGVLAFVLMHLRRRWPLGIGIAVNAFGMLSALSAGPSLLVTFSVATRRQWREIVPVAAMSLAAGIVFSTVNPADDSDPAWVGALLSAIFTVAFVGWGMYVGSRRELVWALHQRAERAEAEQGLRAQQARSTERARIAREMHDVLAHRISRISMRAGALAYREDLDAESLRGGAAEIQQQANDALDELRAVLGVLRDQETGERLDAPQPTHRDIPDLIAQARATGLPVALDDRLTEPLPDALGRTVYRIIQEGITNASKHAPGAVLTVRISGSPADGVSVELRNPVGFGPTRTPGAGLGLIGLSERAELRGGRLDHRMDGAQFVLEGWLPWAA
ncbi:MAG: histidine kinase [Nocardioidaceae bacterium]